MEVYRTQSAHNRISQDFVTRTDYVTVIYGYLLLLCTFVFFCVNMYTMVLSKLMPETGNVIISKNNNSLQETNFWTLLEKTITTAT
jgi:hypothetical protein